MDPIHDNTPLKNARKARKAIKLAAMLATKAMAVLAPLAAASMMFLSVLKISTTYLRMGLASHGFVLNAYVMTFLLFDCDRSNLTLTKRGWKFPTVFFCCSL